MLFIHVWHILCIDRWPRYARELWPHSWQAFHYRGKGHMWIFVARMQSRDKTFMYIHEQIYFATLNTSNQTFPLKSHMWIFAVQRQGIHVYTNILCYTNQTFPLKRKGLTEACTLQIFRLNQLVGFNLNTVLITQPQERFWEVAVFGEAYGEPDPHNHNRRQRRQLLPRFFRPLQIMNRGRTHGKCSHNKRSACACVKWLVALPSHK